MVKPVKSMSIINIYQYECLIECRKYLYLYFFFLKRRKNQPIV